VVPDAATYLNFLKAAFLAEEQYRSTGPDGKVAHAAVRIGDSMLMIGTARGEWKPQSTMLYLYVEDADAWYERALSAGATSIQRVTNQFYGDRSGAVKDAVENSWWIATHTEEVSPEELEKRFKTAR
jgi:uncharacterized glyoxalase superfamily protein PhnB